MTRKMVTAAAAVVALLFSVLALNMTTAEANHPPCQYHPGEGIDAYCAPQAAYPGPFTVHPPAPQAVYGFGESVEVAAASPMVAAPAEGGDHGGGGGTGGGLAHTGSESTVLGYVGTGLIAFGAVALGSRRKFFQGALED